MKNVKVSWTDLLLCTGEQSWELAIYYNSELR